MARKRSTKSQQTTNLVMNFAQLSTALVSFTVANTLILLVANMFFPKLVVLGHHALSPLMGAVYAMVVLSLMVVGSIPIIEFVAAYQQMKLTNFHWMLIYWVVNAGGLWLVGRFAEVVGMGLRSWVVAVVLGLILDLAQGSLMANVVSRVKSG